MSAWFHCWRCRGHSPFATLTRFGVPEKEIKEALRHHTGYQPVETIRKGLKEPSNRGPLQEAHIEYLRSRGFDPAELERIWSIEGLSICGRLSWRIYIPIVHQGQRVSWTARAIGEHAQQRYVSASAEEEAINHKHLVYGLDQCWHTVIIVEGPIDAWAVGPGAGALFGTAFTTPQVARLARVPYRFVCFDNEPQAQRRAIELCHELSVFPGETHRIVLDASDPGSATKRELSRLRKIARLA